MYLYSYGLTDIGIKRLHNEDCFAIVNAHNLFVLADGMGGHAAGHIASQIAVTSIIDYIKNNQTDLDIKQSLMSAFSEANKHVVAAGNNTDSCRGMGTTLSCLLVENDKAFLAHVGDSRIYRYRGGFLEQLTDDHTLVNEQVKKGLMSEEEARVSRFRHILLNGVGIESDVIVDSDVCTVEDGDIFLLCTDGLTNMVQDFEIEKILNTTDLEHIPQKLVSRALEHGGDDNITVIVVGCFEK